MNKLIYIADDDDNIRNLLKTFLEREGFHVLTCRPHHIRRYDART